MSETAAGVRVVTDPAPGATSASLSVWVGAGSRDEPAELAGACHFLEHLLFQGTAHRSAHEVNIAVGSVGGELNAYTSRETTAFFVRVPAADAAMAMELLCEVVSQPALEADDVETERDVILEELSMVNDTPDEVAMSELALTLFPDHGLGRETLGTVSTLEAMTRSDLTAFHGRWYNPANLVVAAAGAVDHSAIVALAERLHSVAAKERPSRPVPNAVAAQTVITERDAEQVHLALGWRGLAQRHDDRFALAVLLHALGDGPSSRLYRTIRDERGLAYSVFSSQTSFTDSGMVALYCATNPSNLDEVRTLLDSELDSVITKGVTPEELRVAVGYLTGSTVMALEDHGTRMSRLGNGWVSQGDVLPVTEVLAGYAAVTHADVTRVAATLLDSPRVTVAVGPVTPDQF